MLSVLCLQVSDIWSYWSGDHAFFCWTLTGVRHMKLLVRGSCLFLLHSYRCQTYEVTGQGIMPFSVALLRGSDIWSYWSGDHAFFCCTLTGVRHMKLLVRGSCIFLLHSYRCWTYEVTGQGIMPFSVALLRVSDIWSYWWGDHAFFCHTLTGVKHMKVDLLAFLVRRLMVATHFVDWQHLSFSTNQSYVTCQDCWWVSGYSILWLFYSLVRWFCVIISVDCQFCTIYNIASHSLCFSLGLCLSLSLSLSVSVCLSSVWFG